MRRQRPRKRVEPRIDELAFEMLRFSRRMTPHEERAPTDPGLERLLEIERVLEERIARAETEARALVDRARERALALARDIRAVAAKTREAERGEREAQERTLASMAAESDARCRSIATIPEEEIDRWAREALSRAIAAPKAGP